MRRRLQRLSFLVSLRRGARHGGLILALALAACGGKKQAEPDEADVACESSDDCGDGDVCRKGECVEAPERELRRRTNTVTPQSVKRDVERIQKQHARDVDRSLEIEE
jgi:hypothetical protein